MTLILTDIFGTAELKTFYSRMLLEKLVPALRHSPQRSYARPRWSLPQSIHRWMTETKIYSRLAEKWVVVVGPCDKAPRMPWSIQYPPGMEPKPALCGTNNWDSYWDTYATGGYFPGHAGKTMWKYYVDPRER